MSQLGIQVEQAGACWNAVLQLLRMVIVSEGEGGIQMHSVKKMDLMGQTEIVVNKQIEVKSQVIKYITVHRQKARE